MASSQDQNPSPARAPKLSGCLQALSLSCGMLILLSTLLIMLTFKYLQSQGPNPNVKTALGEDAAILQAMDDGQKIYEAINYYQASTGNYPDNLLQLVPQSLPDRTTLHSAFDATADPNHVSWTYIKPGPKAPSDSIILKLDYVIPSSGSFELDYEIDGTPDLKRLGKASGFLSVFTN